MVSHRNSLGAVANVSDGRRAYGRIEGQGQAWFLLDQRRRTASVSLSRAAPGSFINLTVLKICVTVTLLPI